MIESGGGECFRFFDGVKQLFDAEHFFRSVILQDTDALHSFFHADAWVEWKCTNERFTVEEYIRANCEYPGNWCGAIEKCICQEGGLILAAKVWPKDESASFHVVSFLRLANGKITAMEEYWSDDGPAPEWRQQMKIGRAIETAEKQKKFGEVHQQ